MLLNVEMMDTYVENIRQGVNNTSKSNINLELVIVTISCLWLQLIKLYYS